MNETKDQIGFYAKELIDKLVANELTYNEENALINALATASYERGESAIFLAKIDNHLKALKSKKKIDLLKDIAVAFRNYFEEGYTFEMTLSSGVVTDIEVDHDEYGDPSLDSATVEFYNIQELIRCSPIPAAIFDNDNEEED